MSSITAPAPERPDGMRDDARTVPDQDAPLWLLAGVEHDEERREPHIWRGID